MCYTFQVLPLKLLPTLERARPRVVLEPCQTSKMEYFAEMVRPLTIIIQLFCTPFVRRIIM